ncbi:MAG: toll/interleukin-1 receptor domain-containing protein, partial [Armatimonadota bacterium]
MDRDDSKLRVFISYSHEDRETVDTIAQVLQHNGLRPMYDKAFSGGTQFHDAIKEYIDCADVFLPVITKASNQRVWLHQEIGYAV